MSQRGVEQSGMKNLEIHAAYRVNCILEFASVWIFFLADHCEVSQAELERS